jgi:hypothetical protein
MISVKAMVFAGSRFPQEDVYKTGKKIVNSQPDKKKRARKKQKGSETFPKFPQP